MLCQTPAQPSPRTWIAAAKKPVTLMPLGLPLSEKQIPQVVENLESGDEPKEALEWTELRPRQVRRNGALTGRQSRLCARASGGLLVNQLKVGFRIGFN